MASALCTALADAHAAFKPRIRAAGARLAAQLLHTATQTPYRGWMRADPYASFSSSGFGHPASDVAQPSPPAPPPRPEATASRWARIMGSGSGAAPTVRESRALELDATVSAAEADAELRTVLDGRAKEASYPAFYADLGSAIYEELLRLTQGTALSLDGAYLEEVTNISRTKQDAAAVVVTFVVIV
jgi:hypothetical protein